MPRDSVIGEKPRKSQPGPGTPDPERVSLWSHDLRAALSDVIGGLRLIDEEGLSDEARVQLSRVRLSGEALARLLDSALQELPGDAMSACGGSDNMHLRRFLSDLESRWAGRAAAKEIGFALDLADGLPALIRAERTTLERALSNLLGNAVKYTDRGTVRLRVMLCGDDDLCFLVVDDGPGFSDAALARLYEFSGRPEGAAKPGRGLGLHIAREMVEDLDGRLEIRNRSEGGAVAEIILPARVWNQPALAAADEALGLTDLSHLRVLVVDDSATSRLTAARMLETMGAEVISAADGVGALDLIERERFDLLLLDIEMPGISGIEVARAVRARRDGVERLPIIALTAYVTRDRRRAIYDAGVDGIIVKPTTSAVHFGMAVREQHERVLYQRGGAVPVVAAAPDRAAPPARPDGVLDPNIFGALMEMASDDGGRELLEKVLADLRSVAAGLEAALAAADIAEIRSQTHILVAVAGAVGATRVQADAEALNRAAHSADIRTLERRGPEALAALATLIGRIAEEYANSGGR